MPAATYDMIFKLRRRESLIFVATINGKYLAKASLLTKVIIKWKVEFIVITTSALRLAKLLVFAIIINRDEVMKE